MVNSLTDETLSAPSAPIFSNLLSGIPESGLCVDRDRDYNCRTYLLVKGRNVLKGHTLFICTIMYFLIQCITLYVIIRKECIKK